MTLTSVLQSAAFVHTQTPPQTPHASDTATSSAPFTVPFFSQFNDISEASWKKVGCGVTSMAMLIDFYKPGDITVDGLLQEGIKAGAYLPGAGWTHQGLADLADAHGLTGATHDLSSLPADDAFMTFADAVKQGPVIASVHYRFEPTNPIPHLVVIDGVDGNTLYYNDPAAHTAGGTISKEQFMSAWKKRYISVKPTT